MSSKLFFPAAVSLALLVFACGRNREEPARAAVPGAEFAADLQALTDTVAARAARGDTVGLVRVMASDSAYRKNVYPLSPAYSATSENAFEFVIGMNKANSGKGLRRLLYDLQSAPGAPAAAAPLDTFPAAEGVVFAAARNLRGVRGMIFWSSALCRLAGCQVVSYARAGRAGAEAENE